MSLQAQLNNSALSKLPKVYAAIQAADQFDASQMESRALREILNCNTPIAEMNQEQIDNVDHNLIATFISKHWMDGVGICDIKG